MKLILTTHNVTLTKAIEDHINARLNQVEHLDHQVVDARVILEHDSSKTGEREFNCSIRLTVHGPDLFAEDRQTDLYSAIDLAAKKLEQQIRKRHNKYKARHNEASESKRKRQEDIL